jgi:hypothetical protein
MIRKFRSSDKKTLTIKNHSKEKSLTPSINYLLCTKCQVPRTVHNVKNWMNVSHVYIIRKNQNGEMFFNVWKILKL